MKRFILSLSLVGGLSFASSAQAVSFGFDCITSSAVACAVGEAQLAVGVTDSGSGTVTLVFSNSDPGTSVVRGIYIDDGSSQIASTSISGGAGTDFKKGGKPKDLPGGSAVSFSDDFRFVARKPKIPNGIGGGESLTIVLTLSGGVTFADVLAAISEGTLRFGVNLTQADPGCVGSTTPACIADPGEGSLVNLPNAVPEPFAAMLGGVACVGLAVIGRRR